jgi:hypothetical protein
MGMDSLKAAPFRAENFIHSPPHAGDLSHRIHREERGALIDDQHIARRLKIPGQSQLPECGDHRRADGAQRV